MIEVIKIGRDMGKVEFECVECGCEFIADKRDCAKGRGIKETGIGKEFYWTCICPNCGNICKGEEEDI